jgi:hypothetical protein
MLRQCVEDKQNTKCHNPMFGCNVNIVKVPRNLHSGSSWHLYFRMWQTEWRERLNNNSAALQSWTVAGGVTTHNYITSAILPLASLSVQKESSFHYLPDSTNFLPVLFTKIVNPLKHAISSEWVYTLSPYLTGNTLRLRYKAQPVNAV